MSVFTAFTYYDSAKGATQVKRLQFVVNFVKSDQKINALKNFPLKSNDLIFLVGTT